MSECRKERVHDQREHCADVKVNGGGSHALGHDFASSVIFRRFLDCFPAVVPKVVREPFYIATLSIISKSDTAHGQLKHIYLQI